MGFLLLNSPDPCDSSPGGWGGGGEQCNKKGKLIQPFRITIFLIALRISSVDLPQGSTPCWQTAGSVIQVLNGNSKVHQLASAQQSLADPLSAQHRAGKVIYCPVVQQG